MKKTPAALLAIPLAASMLLTACGGDPKPSASASSTTSSSPKTTSAPTTSATPTTTVNTKVDPNIPTAARAHTPAGAEAFVRYFHDQLNVAWSKPRAGLLAPLSLPTCKTCNGLEDNATEMVTAHRRMLGNAVRIDSVDAGAVEANGDQTVVITGAQLKTTVVDSTGRTVRTIKTSRIRSLATSHWTASGWRISEIQVLT